MFLMGKVTDLPFLFEKVMRKEVIMNLFQKWMSISLVLRIVIGLIIGAILGFLLPSQQWISIFGDMFV